MQHNIGILVFDIFFILISIFEYDSNSVFIKHSDFISLKISLLEYEKTPNLKL